MTKPNELTLAIERVEEMQQYCENPQSQSQLYSMPIGGIDAESLRLVIEAAKRPGPNPFDEETVSVAASATDLANSWARESGVEEAENEHGLQALIRRLWDHWAAKYYAALSRPTALSGEERRVLEGWIACQTTPLAQQYEDNVLKPEFRISTGMLITAIEAALSLASPFTEEDLRFFRAGVGRDINELENNPRAYPSAHIGGTPALKVLLAKLEAMLGSVGN